MSWSICSVLFAATLTAYACCAMSGRQDDLEQIAPLVQTESDRIAKTGPFF